jgi:DNA-binding transcriptional ArsR family regulator
MNLLHVLSSETGLTVVGGVLGAAWTFFRSTELYRRLQKDRFCKAVEALEAAVDLTYRTYVREIKAAREDGKLTDAEIAEARRRAREAAVEFGRTQGVDVLRELGANYIDLWIGKIVNRLKAA